MKRLLPLTAFVAFALALWLASGDGAEVSPDELLRRCEVSQPHWESYQEDVKAQVGAGPIADWSGTPRAVSLTDKAILVDLDVAPPWDARDAAAPVLLRDAFGDTVRQDAVEPLGDRILRYHFPRSGDPARVPAWVELRFPHGEAWLPLDTDGHW